CYGVERVGDGREAPELRHRAESQLERQLALALRALLSEDRRGDLLADVDCDRSERHRARTIGAVGERTVRRRHWYAVRDIKNIHRRRWRGRPRGERRTSSVVQAP